MKILFLSLSTIDSMDNRGIYPDLIRELVKHDNNVFSVSSIERRKKTKTYIKDCGSAKMLVIKTLNIQKTNLFEKGLGILLIKSQFKKAIKKYFKGIKFDLIIYPTPPITLFGVVKYFKKKYCSKTYLMLKDIFPQNAMDIGLMGTKGFKGLLYKYFRKQEKKLYAISDKIGCMSPANVKYILEHNLELTNNKLEVFPNCIEIQDINLTYEQKRQIRIKYNLPLDKKVFVYGGNLGKPQDIPFIIKCLKAEKNDNNAFFLIIGDGTEFSLLERFSVESKQPNFILHKRLPTDEFDKLLAACDVGLIFLDHRFTIPNFPSRLLSYMQAGLPVLACTDTASDVGQMITNYGFGWWCESNDVDNFVKSVQLALSQNLSTFVKNCSTALNEFSVEKNVNKIINAFYSE